MSTDDERKVLLWHAFSPFLEKPKQKAQHEVKINEIVAENHGETLGHLRVEVEQEGYHRSIGAKFPLL